MAKDKTVQPIKNGSYGKIVSRLPSNMFMTTSGNIVPPFHGYKIGDEVVIENGSYKIGDGTDKSVGDTTSPVSREEFKAMMKRLEEAESKNRELEKFLGDKGSTVGGINA